MSKAKMIVGLDCGAGVSEGLRLVLRSRMDEMCQLRAAALDWSDPEGLHDMRVASRRLRSALRDFSPYLRRSKLRRARDELKAFADALGRVRDGDVALMALEELAAEAPPEVAAGVRLFADERRRKLAGARSELEGTLTEDTLADLRRVFAAALEDWPKASRRPSGVGDRPEEKGAGGVSFRRAGRNIILARLVELQDLSASLYRPFKAEPLHRLRIAAKRLRYAVELFDPCWNNSIKPCAKEIAKMQTSLGELHDCDLWIAELGQALKAARRGRWGLAGKQKGAAAGNRGASGGAAPEPASPAQEREAAFWLLHYFVKTRAAHFNDALARWREWETTGFLARLTDLVNDRAPAEKQAEAGGQEEGQDTVAL